MSPGPAPTVPARRCSECGAELGPNDARCWLCRRDLVIEAALVEPDAPPVIIRPPVSPLQFSLETLLLIVTLSAVCLGALVAMPGLGVLLLVIAVPALVRTCLTGIRSKQSGGKLTATDKVMAFLASAAITWAALAAAGMAFFTACTVSLFTGAAIGEVAGNSFDSRTGELLLWSAVAFCGLVSLAAFIGMFWVTWPARPVQRTHRP
jgi:hypothetical protein